ncbi:hypothetical protein B0I32_111288 [Nonomuraea fuscirosea]|uniref:Uncharacterized protein n=1 Tax=Nonomuraea fuscirosea TaxID=1291556 RepID=A0A2T0MWG0_9ACTN|nr:hypothetical protein [Nonomuraea fuscirosea]PRX63292.1 hypothetical protein B0I32_111288 [Nonomuraea fuscirosea]
MRSAIAGFPPTQEEGDILVRLRDELTHLGLNAELRDNNTALMVHKRKPGIPVWVFVGYGGAYYSWQSAGAAAPDLRSGGCGEAPG